MTDRNASRIAIRFGDSTPKQPSSSGRPAPPSSLGKRHRPHFGNDADSGDDASSEDAQHESITHFGANGAEYVDEDRRQRDQTKSSDGKDTRRRTASSGDDARQKPAASEKQDESEEEETLKYGLTLSKKPKQEAHNDNGGDKEESQPPKTADEEALDALLGKDTGKQRLMHRTEDDAFRDAAAVAPEVDDLATYDAIPVEGFGASLLMGQGWDGQMRGPKTKEIKRRPNGMGLGAKKMAGEEDLGGWDHKGKAKNDKRPRLDEYRRESDRERNRREDRHRDSYKNERDRERDRDRHRDRDRNSRRFRDRDHRS